MFVYPVLAASIARTFADMIIFGYVPLYLYTSGEQSIFQLSLVTAVPAMVRFVSSNFWGTMADVTGRLKLVLLAGLLGYVGACLGLLWVSTGLEAMLVVSMAAAFYGGLSPAGKALVSLHPGPLATADRALAWWLQLESWGWVLGSVAIAVRQWLGASPRALLLVAAGVLLGDLMWVAWRVPNVSGLPATDRLGRGLARHVAELGGEWRRLYANGTLVLLLTVFALANLAGEASFTVFGLYLVGTLGGSEALYGTAVALATGLGLVAYAWLSTGGRRFPAGDLILAGAGLYIPMFAAMAGARTALAAAVAFVIPLYPLVRAGATWTASALTGAGERGGGMGALDGVEALAMTLGAAGAGLVAQAWGFRAVYVGCAALAVVLTLSAWRLRQALLLRQPSQAAARA
ncbi:MAG TPA: MFS transporter [Limnochordales bacterium]